MRPPETALRNCERCTGSYTPYKPKDHETDFLGYYCILPAVNEDGSVKKPQGLCSFHNPKGLFYLGESRVDK